MKNRTIARRPFFAVRMLGITMLGMTLVQSPAAAAELRVLCSNGIRAAVETLLPEAEKKIGRQISIDYSASTRFQKSIEEGAPFDLTILTPAIVDALMKSGKVTAGTHVDIASADLAVGVKAGSPKADVSTPEGMKKRLLAARNMTWTEGGAAGAAIAAMLKSLGIEDQVKPKIVLQQIPGRPAITVADGTNEMMLAPVSEIGPVKGMQVLGLFPKEFQRPVVMTAGISAKAKDPDGAKALVAFLTSPAAASAIEASGMKQVTK